MAGDHDAGSGCNDSVAGGRPAGMPLGLSLANIWQMRIGRVNLKDQRDLKPAQAREVVRSHAKSSRLARPNENSSISAPKEYRALNHIL